jgi:hypothetical protein
MGCVQHPNPDEMKTDSRVLGGMNPTKELDKDKAERNEPRNNREEDRLCSILTQHLRQSPGIQIVSETFYGAPRSEMRSSFDITYDRFYPQIDLLVQNFTRRRYYEDMGFDEEAFNAELAMYRDFARDTLHKQFLPVIDGTVDPEDLAAITIPVRGVKTVAQPKETSDRIPREDDAA